MMLYKIHTVDDKEAISSQNCGIFLSILFFFVTSKQTRVKHKKFKMKNIFYTESSIYIL